MQIAALAEGDQLLDDRAQVLRLRQRGDDLLMLNQRNGHVGEHGAAMLGRTVELSMSVSGTHRWTPRPFAAFQAPQSGEPGMHISDRGCDFGLALSARARNDDPQ